MPRPRKNHVPLSVEIPSGLGAALDVARRVRGETKAAIVARALSRELVLSRPKKKRSRPARV